MGMVVPGSSQVVIFGSMFITVLANVGVDPVVAAAMLPKQSVAGKLVNKAADKVEDVAMMVSDKIKNEM